MRSTTYLGSFLVAAIGLLLSSNAPASAQSGAVHGLSLSGIAQGGCQNLTGFVPPRYPGFPGGIPCQEFLRGVVTIQGQRTNSLSPVGETVATLATTSFTDAFNNSFLQETTDSRVAYGAGNDNYSEFVQDSALRTRGYALYSSGLVNALNVNRSLPRAVAQQQVVDGTSIGFRIEGEKLYIEVLKDASQSIEIAPIDPDSFNDLTNPSRNPYTLGWINPSVSWTPHLSIPEGISFRSSFDQSVLRWRYFIDVNGPALQTIGKYIVFFSLTETKGRIVQYQSQVEGLITREIARSLTATMTIGYGIDQCVAQSVLDIPQMAPLLSVYEATIARTLKDLKKAKRLLRGEPKGSKGKRLFSRQERRIERARIRLSDARALDVKAQTIGIAALDQGAQTTLLLSLSDTAKRIISPGRNGSQESIRRLLKSMKLLLLPRAPEALNVKERKSANKTAKAFKSLIKSGDRALGAYITGVNRLSNKIDAIRENTAQCGAIPL